MHRKPHRHGAYSLEINDNDDAAVSLSAEVQTKKNNETKRKKRRMQLRVTFNVMDAPTAGTSRTRKPIPKNKTTATTKPTNQQTINESKSHKPPMNANDVLRPSMDQNRFQLRWSWPIVFRFSITLQLQQKKCFNIQRIVLVQLQQLDPIDGTSS